MGVALTLAIIVANCLIGVARLSPWLGRRMARSALAVAAFRFSCQIAAGLLLPRRE
jgi:hypothetical protein